MFFLRMLLHERKNILKALCLKGNGQKNELGEEGDSVELFKFRRFVCR